MEEWSVTVFSSVLWLAMSVTLIHFLRKSTHLDDLRYAIFRARWVSLALMVIVLVGAVAVSALLALGLITAGRAIGWAFIPVALGFVTLLACFMYVAKLSFTPPTDPSES